MTQAPAPRPMRSRTGGNIYTVLALVALVALGVAIGFVAYKSLQLTGSSNPFLVLGPSAG